ncbi:MAG: alpha/beta fold hydrolase [Alphaproteobacteria bacterium]|nr:alpha/beta fold hydrolase [Alphaproteobacteria bacterium]
MKIRTAIYALLSLAFGATALAAEEFQTGLTDLAIIDTDGDRNIQGYLWYPTHQTDGLTREHGNGVWEAISVIRGAGPVSGQHPLVILSHGMFGNARNQAWLAKSLTERGYIVAAIDHPGTSTFQRNADHRRELWERANDITRTIDYIIDASKFSDLIDQDRIYMAGHSLGGFTAVMLAGGRYDVDKTDAYCDADPNQLICKIFGKWDVAKTPKDREMISKDWSDDRITAFAVFDLGGTQTFSVESLAKMNNPMFIIGAPLDISGLDLDVESRALVAALPKNNVTYIEPATLSHFDFLGVCTPQALDILKEEEPDDVFVCERGTDERRMEHDEIAQKVVSFFSDR